MATSKKKSGQKQDARAHRANYAAQTAETVAAPSEQLESTARAEQGQQTPKWYVFKGWQDGIAVRDEITGQQVADGANGRAALSLPPPPPWRDFPRRQAHKGQTFRTFPEEVRVVNAAIYLRRPLLLTGLPGTGKSSLAYAIADELG